MSPKKKIRNFHKAVMRELKENKSTFLVYSGLRLLVIIMMILQIINQNYENVFLCLLTLVLMLLPSILQATFKVEFPSMLEIIILLFIFAAEILGEISSFYMRFPHWDTILHTLNGFLCAAVGFSLVDVMNQQKRLLFKMAPSFVSIVSFCFSMTIGAVWEIFEFAMDRIFGLDMQKDTIVHSISTVTLDPLQENNRVVIRDIHNVAVNGTDLGLDGYLDIGVIDTMYDLVVNFVGAIVFSVMGYFYIKHRNTKSLVKELVPEPWSEEKKNLMKKEIEN